MKDVSEIVVTVVDFGSFISLAEKLSETVKKVNYHSSLEREFRNLDDAFIGYGIPKLHKIESFMHPDVIEETDCYVFPDIGYGAEQQYLRSIGKPCWGSNGADEIERLRTKFLKVIKKAGLPVVPYEAIRGLTALSEHLKGVENKWIKINEFRDNMETEHHQDWLHSQPLLNRLSVKFGGARELPWFVVQDALDDATEIGYDGHCIDGEFPESSYQGYEKKNELYLGAMTPYKRLPEEVRFVNEKMSPVLKAYGYRNFWATEIRNHNGTPYFIDPTARMPGQTGEQLLETMENLADVIWHGAQGILIKPIWNAKFAGSATLNYQGDLDDWKVISVAKDAKQWVKLCRYGMVDGDYHFPPNKRQDVGVVIGMADSIEDTIKAVGENFDAIGDDCLSVKLDQFMDLLEDIQKAESEGIEFTPEEVPEPVSVISN